MLRDRFDQLLLLALVATLAALAGLLLTAGPGESRAGAAAEVSRQAERELAYQARLAFIQRRFAPVVDLLDRGAFPDALLKLKEVERDLPGEVHSNLLRGDILFRMGQIERALQELALAVRANGDYVDHDNPLSERTLIEAAVNQGMPQLRDRLRAQPDNQALDQVLKDGYYLQSRLAGGCE